MSMDDIQDLEFETPLEEEVESIGMLAADEMGEFLHLLSCRLEIARLFRD